MSSSFHDLWNGSRLFRQIFLHNGIFKSPNNVDIGKAEYFWWDRHPKLDWSICEKEGCCGLVVSGDNCPNCSSELTQWKWHSGVLYRLHPNGSGGKEYVAHHLRIGRIVFGEVPPGYDVFCVDGNPFNLRKDNIVLLSVVSIPAVDSGVLSIQDALRMEQILGDFIPQVVGRGRPKRHWVYSMVDIASSCGVRVERVRQAISRKELDPGSLKSIVAFCQKKTPKK